MPISGGGYDPTMTDTEAARLCKSFQLYTNDVTAATSPSGWCLPPAAWSNIALTRMRASVAGGGPMYAAAFWAYEGAHPPTP